MSQQNDAMVGVLALGDSYTVGTAISDESRWLNRVIRRLRDRGIDVAEPTVIATDGWTAAELVDAIDRHGIHEEYALVTLLAGVNDVYDGRPVEEFRPVFVDLLERAIDLAGGPENVLALTIPDYTLTPVGQQKDPAEDAERLASYNRLIEAEVDRRGVRVVDVVPISRRVHDNGDLVADDGLHPSAAQHELWADRLFPAIVDILET